MTETRVIDVNCQCGQEIARYRKEGRGVLRKMYLDMIIQDYTGRLLTEPPLDIGSDISCPSCDRRIATIRMIHGRPAVKMNQGAIRRIAT